MSLSYSQRIAFNFSIKLMPGVALTSTLTSPPDWLCSPLISWKKSQKPHEVLEGGRRSGIGSNKGKEKDTEPHTAHDSSKRALPALAMEQLCHFWGSSAHSQTPHAQWPWCFLHSLVRNSMQCGLCGNLFFSVGNPFAESTNAFFWLLHIFCPIFLPWAQQANCSWYWKPFIPLVSHVDLVSHDTSCGQLCTLHNPQNQSQVVTSWMIKTSGQNLVTTGGKS